jgi:hypothetical protein
MQTLDPAIMRTLLTAIETGNFAGAAHKVGRSESDRLRIILEECLALSMQTT